MSTWMILASGAKVGDLAGDPVVEAAAQGDEQVGLLHGGDRGVVAVHARHAEAQRVVVGEGAPGHQRGDDVDAGQLGQLPQRLGRPGLEDAAAGVDDRPAGCEDQLGRLLDHLRGGPWWSACSRAGRGHLGVVGQYHSMAESGFLGSTMSLGMSTSTGPGRPVVAMWNASRIDHAGCPGPSVTSSLCLVTERVMPTVSHSWKASVPMAGVRHLAGDARPSGSSPCRRRTAGVTMLVAAGPAGHHGHARPAGGVGVALGHVAGALLVAHEDVADRRVDDAGRRRAGWRRRGGRT